MSASPLQLVSPQYLGISRRQRLWLEEGKRCHWCRRDTRFSDDEAWDSTTIDHIIPRYKGGTNDPANLVGACRLCNNRRSHEDSLRLKEGALLGKFTVPDNDKTTKPNIGKASRSKHVALTGDEKKAISTKISAYQNHVEQRDQALREIKILRERIGVLESDAHLSRIMANDKDAEIAALKQRIEKRTVSYLIRERIATWLLR